MNQLWKILKFSDLLVSRVLKNKYFQNLGLLNYKSKGSDSFLWKSLCSFLEIFKSGIGQSNIGNEIVWNHSSSVESSNIEAQERFWSKFSRTRVPDRVKFVAWRVYHNVLPLEECLKKRGVLRNFDCVFCGHKGEDAKHLFMSCWWAKALWSRTAVGFSSEELYGLPKE